MFILLAVSIYTSRIVLHNLGVMDFGINNAVAGFVSMFSIISASMTTTISRFFTFELGTKNIENLKKVFITSLNIQILLSLLVVLFAETIGLWFLNYKMVIPENRMQAANFVYQFSLLSFCIEILSVPYNAAIVAHEQMSSFAYISLLEAGFKLLIAYLIVISPIDRLITYSFLYLLTSFIIRIIYGTYCKLHFKEVSYSPKIYKNLFKRMMIFSGWNYLGSGAFIIRTSGLNVLINLFFGAAANAAKGVASQVENAVNQFVNSFIIAINPQIIKSYADNNYEYMYKLICVGAKYSFLLVYLLIVPIILEAPYILHLWLINVPDGTVIFLRLTLLVILFDTLSNTLTTAMQANGNIRNFQLIVSFINFLIFPATYISYKLGYAAYYCYIWSIIAMIIKLFFELPLLKNMIKLRPITYVKNVIFKLIPSFFIIPLFPIYLHIRFDEGIYRLVGVVVTTLIMGFFSIYTFSANSIERSWFKNMIKKRLGI